MRFALLIIALLWATPVLAFTEKYADFANGNDANTCTNAGADECKTLQRCIDVASAGTRCNIEWDSSAMTNTLSAPIDCDTANGTIDDPIIVQGYSSTVGDGTYAVIDGNSAASQIFVVSNCDFYVWKHLELKGSTGDAFDVTSGNADWHMISEVKITNAGGDGIEGILNSDGLQVRGSEIGNTTTTGIQFLDATHVYVMDSYIHDTSGVGVECVSNQEFCAIGNIFDTSATANIVLEDNNSLYGNTFYNATGAGADNISVGSTAEGITISSNIFSTAADYNLAIAAGGNVWISSNNDYHAGTTGTSTGTIHLEDGKQTVDPGFTDAPNGDFNIGANLDDLGYPASFLGASSTTAHREIGAVMYEESGGGGTTAFTFVQ